MLSKKLDLKPFHTQEELTKLRRAWVEKNFPGLQIGDLNNPQLAVMLLEEGQSTIDLIEEEMKKKGTLLIVPITRMKQLETKAVSVFGQEEHLKPIQQKLIAAFRRDVSDCPFKPEKELKSKKAIRYQLDLYRRLFCWLLEQVPYLYEPTTPFSRDLRVPMEMAEKQEMEIALFNQMETQNIKPVYALGQKILLLDKQKQILITPFSEIELTNTQMKIVEGFFELLIPETNWVTHKALLERLRESDHHKERYFLKNNLNTNLELKKILQPVQKKGHGRIEFHFPKRNKRKKKPQRYRQIMESNAVTQIQESLKWQRELINNPDKREELIQQAQIVEDMLNEGLLGKSGVELRQFIDSYKKKGLKIIK